MLNFIQKNFIKISLNKLFLVNIVQCEMDSLAIWHI